MRNSIFERILNSKLAKSAGLAAALCLPVSSQAAGLADLAKQVWSRTTVYGYTENGQVFDSFDRNRVHGLAVVVKAPVTTASQTNPLRAMAENMRAVSGALGSGYVVSDLSGFTRAQDHRMHAADKDSNWFTGTVAGLMVAGGVAAILINGSESQGSNSDRDPDEDSKAAPAEGS